MLGKMSSTVSFPLTVSMQLSVMLRVMFSSEFVDETVPSLWYMIAYVNDALVGPKMWMKVVPFP